MAMRWEDFSFPGSPMRRRIGFDSATRRIVIEAHQPGMDLCLKANQEKRNATRPSSSLWNGADWVQVASIPLWLLEKWQIEEGINPYSKEDWPRILAKLNAPEYQALRTAPGRI